MDDLKQAIFNAGKELGDEHHWLFEEGSSEPLPDGCFVEVLAKHLRPLMSTDYVASRIATLKAEIAALEANDE